MKKLSKGERLLKLCQKLTKHKKVWVRYIVIKDEKGWQRMRKYDKVWQSVKKFVIVWHSFTKFYKVWQIVKNCEKVWQSVKKFEKVWKILTKCENFWQSVKKCVKNLLLKITSLKKMCTCRYQKDGFQKKHNFEHFPLLEFSIVNLKFRLFILKNKIKLIIKKETTFTIRFCFLSNKPSEGC
jgi:hypothetical protein